ncbi:Nitrate reductase cytochrome c550-type subunit [hydrothermal vent metagenome]|uniref:Periplasmic nitrate reductase, electron transfer subunit n=1 Tax=hydrothermal vent metagenome TaxID=652676 RepID=A0A1W1C5T8_9ZZZZ
MIRKSLIIACSMVTLISIGYAETASNESAKNLSLRKGDAFSESDIVVAETKYSDKAPGTSTKIERAFQDAPPMIPHSVEGLLPIKAGNNACLGCHMPEVAPAMKATPIPKTHFTNFRPKHKFDGKKFEKVIDNLKNEVAISKPSDKLSMARFNCSQCHAPQSSNKLPVENTFKPVFSSKDGATKSHWYEHMTDDLATVGEGNSVVTEADKANLNSAAGSMDSTH